MAQKYLLKIIQLGLILALFTPLIVSPSTPFPFIVGKAVFFQTLMGILLILWIALLILDWPKKRFLPKLDWLVISVFAYFGILALSNIFSIDPSHSFWGNMERMEGTFSFFHLLIFFVILISVFKTKREWLWFLRGALIVGFSMSIFAIGQKFGLWGLNLTGGRPPSEPQGTIGNYVLLASYLVFPIFLSLFLLTWQMTRVKPWQTWQNDEGKLTRVKPWHWQAGQILFSHYFSHYWRLFYFLCLAFALLALIFTTGRAAMLGTILGILIFLGLYSSFITSQRFRRLSKIFIFSILIIGILSLTILYLHRDSPWLQDKILLHKLAHPVSPSRFSAWQIGWQGFLARPILGWGPESYSILFSKFYNPQISSYSVEWYDRPHQKTLEVMAHSGILGLLAYLSIFGAAIYSLLKRKNLAAFCLIGLLVAYFIQNQFMLDILSSYIMFFLTLGLINQITNYKLQITNKTQ